MAIHAANTAETAVSWSIFVGPARRLLAVADSDSYLKWSAATVSRLPESWSADQVLVDSPIRPSPTQIRSAAGESVVPVLSYRRLVERIRRTRPDAVLLACTGPVVAQLSRALCGNPDRPVLVTGIPGISYPASARALDYRLGCDLFLVHSLRERAAYLTLAEGRRQSPEFGLARMPYLPQSAPGGDSSGPLLFAAQAKVPGARADRARILRALSRAAPTVVKLRGSGGEAQTHAERWPYPELAQGGWRQTRTYCAASGHAVHGVGVVADRTPLSDSSAALCATCPEACSLRPPLDSTLLNLPGVSFSTEPLESLLRSARGLVTVSSTAALEAIAMEVPTMIIGDFGVSDELINTVFADSGLVGRLDDLAGGGLRQPRSEWLRDNYFHPPAADDWARRLDGMVARRGDLPVRTPPRVRLRHRLRLTPAARTLTALRRIACRG